MCAYCATSTSSARMKMARPDEPADRDAANRPVTVAVVLTCGQATGSIAPRRTSTIGSRSKIQARMWQCDRGALACSQTAVSRTAVLARPRLAPVSQVGRP